MIKAYLFFILVWVLVAVGVKLFRAATNKERWSVAKMIAFSSVTALIAVILVGLMVVFF